MITLINKEETQYKEDTMLIEFLRIKNTNKE